MLLQIYKPVFIFLSSIRDRDPLFNRKRWSNRPLLTSKIYLRNVPKLSTPYWFSSLFIILSLGPSFSANISDQAVAIIMEICQKPKLKIQRKLGVKIGSKGQQLITVWWICPWFYMLLGARYRDIQFCTLSMIGHLASTMFIYLWSGFL